MSDSVENGREALHRWFEYPWYDSKTDELRPVRLSEPWNFDFGNWNFHLPTSPIQWIAWIVVVLLLCGAVYLLIRAFANREKAGARRVKETPGRADRIEALPIPDKQVAPEDFLAEAQRCREQGDYGRALVYLYSHQLWQLDRHGRVRLARGKTNRQYLREVSLFPSLRSLVETTMLRFEDFFFGHHAVDRPSFDALWSRLGEFDSLVAAGNR